MRCSFLHAALALTIVALPAAAALAPGEAAVDTSKLPPAAPGRVDFVREIQPLFAKRCTACHGSTKLMGGLRLHRREDAMLGGDHGLSVVPGKSAESRLVHYVAGLVEGKVMPPAGPRLTPAEIGKLRAWIDQGAAWPREADAATEKSAHWAFQPVQRPALPPVKAAGWAVNPVDRFILARLEKAGLRPSPPADRVTLVRRVTLDLTGLPPTPEEVSAFVNDRKPGAYERVVDRLLASPHYGERWARHWLDLARYADSNGYTVDGPRQMWMWRDWVIRAFNEDRPFDQFTIEQLAGDLLPNATDSQRVATGFHRNTLINEEGGTDPEQFRNEAVVDRANTTGVVWLGLTMGCAQCHTHKYDPVTQREYYQLFAFFNNQDEPTAAFPTPEQAKQQKELKAALAAAQKALAEYDKQKPPRGDKRRAELAREVRELTADDKKLAAEIPTAMVLRERAKPRESFVQIRGDFLRHGIQVRPGVPSVLPALAVSTPAPTRLDLARWLVDGRNPLTARVTVNRLWQQLFGKGLVETENDFGLQGTPPTHPKLLDYLASVFAAPSGSPSGHGWSVKRLLRLIVTSATYRQASAIPHSAFRITHSKDPSNKLLGRQNRLRLDAELIRDSALAASGLLSRKIGGPSVFPPQPAGLDLLTQVKRNWTASKGEDRYRRGLYTWIWRSNPYAMFAAFDAPSGNAVCTRRARSNTPLQSLMLANDAGFLEMAQALAARVLRETSGPDDERLRYAFRLCLAREPSPKESERLARYYRAQLAAFSGSAEEANNAAPKELPQGATPAEGAAWTAVARVLLNLDEFITRE